MTLEAHLLGKFELRTDGRPIAITSRPAQSLFAYLILYPGTAHRRERLAGLLWPDSLEETARDNLRHALWRVRKALTAGGADGYLKADDLTITFDPSLDYWLDSRALDKVGEGASADELMTASAVYGGELLPGFYDEWVMLEREHLRSVFEHHMARLMSLLEMEERWLDVLDWGERWIKLGEKPEPAYRALMTAHAAKGDMSRVAATYERCTKAMRDLGIEPSEQTKALYARLKSGQDGSQRRGLTAKRVGEVVSNIPVPLTSFIGRERELKEIARLLKDSRLLTLTGPGGVGKTRLAIQTAQAQRKTFKDGAYWVGLVGLSDENLIPQEIAASLEVREVPDETLLETLTAQLRTRELLLVIDNCEHLIRACAQYVEQILVGAPRVKILATSIEALGLFDETVWQVPSLPLPQSEKRASIRELGENASVALFCERASHARPGFALTEDNAGAVAQICQRLDGIPLAIELAAARIKVLSVDEIATRLDDRFSLLTAGSRTAIPRHQTLRATIDWSYELLAEPERLLFRRVSVFAGGFTLEAAEAVCGHGVISGGILDPLGRLVDKSLVIAETDAEVGGTRYRLLETVRQYALEKLVETADATEARDRHLAFCLDFAERSEPNIFGSESAIWFRRLDKEIDNIRAALEWSTANGKAELALRIAGALVYFWFARGLVGSEWDDRVQQALARPEGLKRTLARAKALNGIGFMYWADVYPTDRRAELEEALSIGREFDDPSTTATALRNLGLSEMLEEDYEQALAYFEQSLAIWSAMGPDGRFGYANTLIFLGDAALKQGRTEAARSWFEEAAAILRAQGPGDLNFLAYAVRRLGQLLWRDGKASEAVPLCRESLNLNVEIGDPRGIMASLAAFAAIAVVRGRLERATQLMAAIETHLVTMGKHLLYVDRREYERNLERVREGLEAKAFARSWAKGQSMSLNQTIAFAVEEG